MAAKGINSPLTSSAGRLFDAAAAMLGVRDTINYEGQAAIELEQLADIRRGRQRTRPALETGGGPFTIRGSDLLHAVIEDRTGRVPAPVIAARFHHGVAALIEAGCLLMRERYGLGTVALSGGVFQNLLLLQRHRGPAGGPRLPRPAALPRPVQRRRHQPRPGRGRGQQSALAG